ncbi:MAG: SH3 domain-containing protein [Alphaproteobacteria bacterium]
MHKLPLLFALALLVAPAFAAAPPAQQSLGPVTNLPLPRFVSLKRGEVNMRRGPSEDQPVLWVYKRKNMPVEVVNEFDVWRKVRDVDGAEGWVRDQMLSGDARYALVRWPPTKTPRGITGATGKAPGWPLKRRPQEKSVTLAIVQPGVVAKLGAVHRGVVRGQGRRQVRLAGAAALWGVYPDEEINSAATCRSLQRMSRARRADAYDPPGGTGRAGAPCVEGRGAPC